MYNKKVLLFLSLFFIETSLLNGQIKDSCSMYSICDSEIDTVKLNIYKSILQSQELQKNKQCHIVGVDPISLDMKYSPGYEARFYDIKEIDDSTSIYNLKNFFPNSYKFYFIRDKVSNSLENKDYIFYLERLEEKNDTHSLNYFYDEICENSYDIIKIQAPLDSWAKVYEANILLNKASVIIPVIYESFIDKPKYLLYKIELYKGSTKVKIKDDKIEFLENIPDEDIINEIREQLRDIFKKGKYTITYEYKHIIGEKGISIDIFNKKQPKKRYSILGGIIGAFIEN
ncbi:hypothetical protein [Apibacter sp. HY039]|uniref:hypothetical protein n=1 Tax=Apibacter sp. HY039 TaxID=2501476 RepID=UPI000FEC0BF8|nr:hypothetical protein [Apibacter sp. HY039]